MEVTIGGYSGIGGGSKKISTKKSKNIASLKDLKGWTPNRLCIYTNAKAGVGGLLYLGGGVSELTDWCPFTGSKRKNDDSSEKESNLKGLDFVLAEKLDFLYDPTDLTQEMRGLTWMKRETKGKEEILRYHSLSSIDQNLLGQQAEEMQNRIDFLCDEDSSALYDVTKALLEEKHQVIILLSNKKLHFIPKEKGHSMKIIM